MDIKQMLKDTTDQQNHARWTGSLYAFAKDINIEWKHGIPQIDPAKAHKNGRISISKNKK